ncbi:MAG TPA: transglycosylase SLT domain-containing protein, partial [Chroococcales cyanobacterium]
YIRTSENQPAIDLLLKIRKQYAGSDFARGAAYYLGVIKANDPTDPNSPAAAFELFRQYLKGNEDGRFAVEVVGRMVQLAHDQPTLVLTTDDRNTFGDVFFAAGRWKDALEQWPDMTSAQKRLRKAVCYLHTRTKKEAIKALLDAIKAAPDCHYVPTATLISDPLTREETKVFWQEVLQAHPRKEDAPLWNIAKRSEAPQALPLYRQLIARYPTSEFAPESVWWLFWHQMKEANRDPARYSEALSLAREGISRYPTSKAAARLGFWQGKIYERLKQPENAKHSYLLTIGRFGNDYYAMRSRARLRAIIAKEPDRGFATSPERGEHLPDWQWPSPQSLTSAQKLSAHSATLGELFKLRQYDECLKLLPSSSSPELKSAIYAAGDQPMQAIGAVTRNLTGSPRTTLRWKLAYPLEYGRTVTSGARGYGIDPLLVQALIREESRYYPQALSRSKAIGLMQLMPATAYGVAKRIGVPLASQADIYKPEINIKLGTDYLAYTIKRFQGNAMLAVASYNGGPNAVRAWSDDYARNGFSDQDGFVEEIRFRETRDYVRKVFGSYWNYEHIYGLSEKDRHVEEEITEAAHAAEKQAAASLPSQSETAADDARSQSNGVAQAHTSAPGSGSARGSHSKTGAASRPSHQPVKAGSALKSNATVYGHHRTKP